jgi:hypothetical protein
MSSLGDKLVAALTPARNAGVDWLRGRPLVAVVVLARFELRVGNVQAK